MAIAQSLAPNAQDGSVHTRDVLASFLEGGRKWRRVVHLYKQSLCGWMDQCYYKQEYDSVERIHLQLLYETTVKFIRSGFMNFTSIINNTFTSIIITMLLFSLCTTCIRRVHNMH